MNREELQKLVEANYAWTVEKRRALHRIPEEGFREFKTQQLICETLEELKIPYTIEKTWVVGLIEGAQPGRCIGLRADIDALPIQETSGEAYASETPGVMHACGHDAHIACLLGAAQRKELCGEVRFVFQPAEEIGEGAKPFVAAGALELP